MSLFYLKLDNSYDDIIFMKEEMFEEIRSFCLAFSNINVLKMINNDKRDFFT